MAKKVARKGDPTSHGGMILTGSSSRKVNGLDVARVDDQVSCPTHGNNAIIEGSSGVLCDGKKVAQVGDKTACGASIISGSSDVFIGTDAGGGVSQVAADNGTIVEYYERDYGAVDDDDEPGDGLLIYPPVEGRSPTAEEFARSEAAQIPETANVEDTGTVASTAPLSAACTGITDDTPGSFQLSTSYTLAQVSSSAVISRKAVVAQKGLTKAEIICNLRAVCVNCLEPIVTKYGRANILVTSGFRTGSGNSQHFKGQAIDIQFPGCSNAEIFARAQWVKANVAYDQFILEYHATYPVLHLSFNVEGLRRKVNTMRKDTTVIAGLVQLRA